MTRKPRSKKKVYVFSIAVRSPGSRKDVRKALDALINSGLADARETVENGAGGLQAARVALDADWSPPQ